MANSWTNTDSVKFFLRKYHRATLPEAAEAAAQKARELLMEGLSGFYRIPVDIETIAQRMGIELGGFLEATDRRLGALFSEGNKYIAKVASNVSVGGDRFTLAHEIGHSLFRQGSKHSISSIARLEKEAEDRISTMFAAALLMPAQKMPQVIEQIPSGEPWEIIKVLERAARRFLVSLPAMILRVGQIHCRQAPSMILLCLEYFVNHYTGTLPCLRVLICSRLGKLSNVRTWYNRSAEGLGLQSALSLFTEWSQIMEKDGETTGGRYTLDTNGKLVRASQTTFNWLSERLNLSIYTGGSWKKESMQLQVANCLYARKGWEKNQAYLVSIIKGC